MSIKMVVNQRSLELAMIASSGFFTAVCAFATEDSDSGEKLCQTCPWPETYIEFDTDKGGVRAFLLAVAERAVVILKEAKEG